MSNRGRPSCYPRCTPMVKGHILTASFSQHCNQSASSSRFSCHLTFRTSLPCRVFGLSVRHDVLLLCWSHVLLFNLLLSSVTESTVQSLRWTTEEQLAQVRIPLQPFLGCLQFSAFLLSWRKWVTSSSDPTIMSLRTSQCCQLWWTVY